MSRALIVLDSRFQRQKAADWCWSLKDGTRVEFKAPQRSDDQNSKMWAMLTEVSVQLKWHGLKLTPDDWKLQFLDALRRAHGDQVRVVPNTDNSGFVNLGTSSSDLSKDEMSDLIELIFKFGAEHDVKFNDPNSQSSDLPRSDEQGSGTADPSTSSAADPIASQGVNGEAEQSNVGDGPAASSASSDPIVRNLSAECLDKFMAIATDAKLSVQERRDNLEFAKEPWKEALPTRHDFVKACLTTADKVAKGELGADAARRYLDGLI